MKSVVRNGLVAIGGVSCRCGRSWLDRDRPGTDGQVGSDATSSRSPMIVVDDSRSHGSRRRSGSRQSRAARDSNRIPARSKAFRRHLEVSFPLVHASLDREIVNGHSLLFTWNGNDPSTKPILLMAHMDVVPVEPGTEAAWTHDPFSGDVADGFVWGRGTLDDKVGVMAMLEAVETLLNQRFQPGQTILLAFGHDEEVGGADRCREDRRALEGERNQAPVCARRRLGDHRWDRPWPAISGGADRHRRKRVGQYRAGGGVAGRAFSSMPPPQTAAGIVAAAVIGP